jgi:hypothetical protein
MTSVLWKLAPYTEKAALFFKMLEVNAGVSGLIVKILEELLRDTSKEQNKQGF